MSVSVINPSCIGGRILKVWQYIEDASLMVLAKNYQKFCTGKGDRPL